VLLLHGQPGSARDWRRLRHALAGRVVSIASERPGWNGTDRPTGLEGNAAAALATLDAAGYARATIVGHSFGAAVAAWLAITRPERVHALVLVAPAANPDSLIPLDHLLAAPVLGDLLSGWALLGAGLALAAPPVRARLAERFSLDHGYLRAAGRTLIRPASWRAFCAEQRVLVRELPLLEPRLGQIQVPVTIVIGTADRVVPPASARKLADQIPGARLIQLERANHLLPQGRARELAEVIVTASLQGRRGAAGRPRGRDGGVQTRAQAD
jgi:pimeloyl-ACP methyl ester carboxylesterase